MPSCKHAGCKAPAVYAAADDSAEWTHVCEQHLGASFRPDAWERIGPSLRALVKSEVTFEVTIEPEDSEPDFDDPRDNDFIRQRLEQEQQEAWCVLTVTAAWTLPATGEVFTASASLGSLSIDAGEYADGHAVAKAAELHAVGADLYDDALTNLNERLRATVIQAAAIIAALRDPKRPQG
jgi:hypothetical protein